MKHINFIYESAHRHAEAYLEVCEFSKEDSDRVIQSIRNCIEAILVSEQMRKCEEDLDCQIQN